MSCPHRETTLSWCHGETEDDAILTHLADCAGCRETVAEVEAVWAAVAGRILPTSSLGARRSLPWVAAAAAPLLLAAGLALWPSPPPAAEPVEVAMDALDAELFDLELELDQLDSDLADL